MLTILFLVMGCIILGMAIKEQVEYRKNMLICHGQLWIWYKFLDVARQDQPELYKNLENCNWEILSREYTGNHDLSCPLAKPYMGYVLHAEAVSYFWKATNQQINTTGHSVLIWESDENMPIWGNGPQSNISKRHFGGSHILRDNGAIELSIP